MTEKTSSASHPFITPFILGHGRAAQAIAQSLAFLSDSFSASKTPNPPERFSLHAPIWLPRGADLKSALQGVENPLVCIASPHALHADSILAAEAAGARAILCEKPACVNSAQAESLRKVRTPTAVLHGYRATWGIQTLKRMIEGGELGELIAIEGRYWQSSTAARALLEDTSPSWKNDVSLSGESDVYFDIGSHWIDAASFLVGELPTEIRGWRSYANSPAPHRDSHVQVSLPFASGTRGSASFSKTVHGSANDFEIHVLGTLKSATWEFLRPDEIQVGEGAVRSRRVREDSALGSRFSPFHGTGWIEGYTEITRSLLLDAFYGKTANYPKLVPNLDLISAMLRTHWS
jgi:predicted dehydrogenase